MVIIIMMMMKMMMMMMMTMMMMIMMMIKLYLTDPPGCSFLLRYNRKYANIYKIEKIEMSTYELI